MRRAVIGLLLGCAACASVRIDADGTTRIRTLGKVNVETRACAEAPSRVRVPPCVGVQGSATSEAASGIVSALIGFLLGR
jgi:hypothetical protein